MTLSALDDATRLLVRLAAAIAGGDEPTLRDAFAATRPSAVPDAWVEELVLQSHLFSGFPRALNAAREWRRLVPAAPAAEAVEPGDAERWRRRGEATCAAVYGGMYDRLRASVAGLHPLLDEWMVTDGYGKVLGRPGLDLPRRELCIVAACAASGQDRQLHSHLHGALNVGVAGPVLEQAVEALAGLLGPERYRPTSALLHKVLARQDVNQAG